MRSSRKLREALRFAISALALMLIPLALGSVYTLMRTEFAQARELRATTEATLITRHELEQLLISHIDAETAVRGYVISEDPAFLLTGDRVLREAAEAEGIAVHGLLWLLDRMEAEGVCDHPTLHAGLTKTADHPRCRLPRREIDARLRRYAGN